MMMMTCGWFTQLLIMPTVCLCGEQQAQQQQFSVSKHPGIGRDALFIQSYPRQHTDPALASVNVRIQIQTAEF